MYQKGDQKTGNAPWWTGWKELWDCIEASPRATTGWCSGSEICVGAGAGGGGAVLSGLSVREGFPLRMIVVIIASNHGFGAARSGIQGCGMGRVGRHDRALLSGVTVLRLMMLVRLGIVRVMED